MSPQNVLSLQASPGDIEGVVLSEMPGGGTMTCKMSSRRPRMSWHGCCRIPRSCEMARWPWIFRAQPTRLCWRVRRAGGFHHSPVQAALSPWGSSRVPGGWKMLEMLVPSWITLWPPSPPGCTLGALLKYVNNIKVFNFPYKIQSVKLNLTVAWRGRRRRNRRRREAVSSPEVTPVMFSHKSDFHGLWDWPGMWVWTAQKFQVLLQCCILTPQHLCLSQRIHLQKCGWLCSEKIYPWCSWLHPHERGISG